MIEFLKAIGYNVIDVNENVVYRDGNERIETNDCLIEVQYEVGCRINSKHEWVTYYSTLHVMVKENNTVVIITIADCDDDVILGTFEFEMAKAILKLLKEGKTK